MARPSKYSKKTAQDICDRISEGEFLTAIAEEAKYPHCRTLYRWLDKHEEFRQMYARAQQDRCNYWLREIMQISDDGQNDYMKRTGKYGKTYIGPKHDHISRSKLRVDTRKWAMAKLWPSRFGDAMSLQHSTPEPLKPIKFVVVSDDDEPAE